MTRLVAKPDAHFGKAAALRAADRKKLTRIAASIRSLAQDARLLLPKECRIVGGEYDGRLARVDGIVVDGVELMVAVMVYRATRKGAPVNREVLNTNVESRRARRLNEIEFLYHGERSV